MINKHEAIEMITDPVISTEACFHTIVLQLEEIIKLLKGEKPSEMAERLDIESVEAVIELAETLPVKQKQPRKKKVVQEMATQEIVVQELAE